MQSGLTPIQVKQVFSENGLSISEWARENGFSQVLVYQILSGKRKPTRGESHRIAVKLGLKLGGTSDYSEIDNLLKEKSMNR